MARVLLTWELGGGLGHLMNLRPLAASLAARGHQVFVAAKDLSQTPRAFANEQVTLLAAPWNTRRRRTAELILTYADLLLNVGFDDEASLAAHVDAWRNLFALVQPDLLVCDHSPTALLAARGAHFAVATVGTGFFCPIDESPLRLLRNMPSDNQKAAIDREVKLLDTMNRVLARCSLPRLERVTGLYHDGAIEHFLVTFAELDHFTGRGAARYWGAWPYGLPGQPFVRPDREPCLFAYLKPFPAVIDMLTSLAASPISAVMYIDGLRDVDKARFRSDRIRFADGPVDIRQAAAGCDVALTNSNHGTCVAMLLAGKPLVNVPPYLEQSLLARAIDRLGASITVPASDGAGICRAVEQVLTSPKHTQAAEAFAQRYRQHDFDELATKMLDELERLACSGAKT